MSAETTEKEPEIIFEHDCPVEEIAGFLSADTLDENRRIRYTPESAKERTEGFLKKPNATELVLRKDGELIGCAFSFEHDEDELKEKVPYAKFFTGDEERVFEIKGVRIKSKYQGQGFGRMIMEKLMQDTKEKGATKLVLSTFPEEDSPARILYEKLGFTEVAPNQKPDSFYMQYEYPEEK